MKKMMAALTLAMIMMFFIPVAAIAGDLEPSAAPDSTMKTLQEIYDKLDTLQTVQDEIINEICPRSTTPLCACGDRFEDNGDGTVTDCQTNLIWLKDANCYGGQNWNTAITSAAELNNGECGLTDGSVEGDWHLATKEELQGIGTDPPTTWNNGRSPVTWTMPGVPFINVQNLFYWSGTVYNSIAAWHMDMGMGEVGSHPKDSGLYVWPVRSGN